VPGGAAMLADWFCSMVSLKSVRRTPATKGGAEHHVENRAHPESDHGLAQ